MSKADTWEAGLLDLLFLNTDFTLVGDAGGLRGSVSAGSLYLSLHTADPGEAGTQATNECAYTSYARVAIARSGAGFTRSGNAISLAANADFPAATGGSETATHWGLGTSSSGAGKLLYKGSLSSSLAISSGVQPRILAGTAVTED